MKKIMEWEKEYKIPIRVLKAEPTRSFGAPIVFRFAYSAFRKSMVFGAMVLLVISQSAVFNAFEAHVINVTATIEDGIAEYVVINEVYYDVGNRKFCAVDEESEPRNEWIELYNPTDEQIDVSGWTIEDNNSSDIIPNSPAIPSHGFAVISKNSSTWLFWSIPPETVKIELGSVIGNGLSNDGDRVILKDASGAEIDAVSYGDDTYAFVPSVPSVPESHSIARSPKGFDTNKASDWVELEIPNPGTNPHYETHTDGTPCSGSLVSSGGNDGNGNGDISDGAIDLATTTIDVATSTSADDSIVQDEDGQTGEINGETGDTEENIEDNGGEESGDGGEEVGDLEDGDNEEKNDDEAGEDNGDENGAEEENGYSEDLDLSDSDEIIEETDDLVENNESDEEEKLEEPQDNEVDIKETDSSKGDDNEEGDREEDDDGEDDGEIEADENKTSGE